MPPHEMVYTTSTMLGLAGAFIYIGGFFLLQIGAICGNGNLFATTRVIAALLVLLSLIDNFNLGAFLIQISFALIGIIGISYRLYLNAKEKKGGLTSHPISPCSSVRYVPVPRVASQ